MSSHRWAPIPIVLVAACSATPTAAPPEAPDPPATPAPPGPSRGDDLEFLRRLSERGYRELVLREIERLPPGEDAEHARCQLLRREALLAAASEKSDPAEVRDKFSAASKAIEAFLESHPDSRRKSEAEFNLANLLKDHAYYLVNHRDRFPAAAQGGVVTQANGIFEDAIRHLQTIRQRDQDRADAAMKDLAQDREDAYRDGNIAWYYLCMVLHDRAMLLPAGDALRTQRLTQAIDETLRLLEETDGQIFGYLAGNLLGQQYWHRGERKQGADASDIRLAEEMFLGTIDAVDTYTNVENDWPALVDAILQATVDYGRMCNAVGSLEDVDYRKAFLGQIERLDAKIPASMRDHRLVPRVRAETERALAPR